MMPVYLIMVCHNNIKTRICLCTSWRTEEVVNAMILNGYGVHVAQIDLKNMPSLSNVERDRIAALLSLVDDQ